MCTKLVTCFTISLFVDCFWNVQDIIYYLNWFSSVIIPLLWIGIGGAVDYVLVNINVCSAVLREA